MMPSLNPPEMVRDQEKSAASGAAKEAAQASEEVKWKRSLRSISELLQLVVLPPLSLYIYICLYLSENQRSIMHFNAFLVGRCKKIEDV